MKYRPHIDGLRAIAILFVLFFHAGFSIFPSGFIGVDIFFVISGFLITGIIYESLLKDQFSFIHFYNRRLWRLQPIFICLLIATTILTLIFYLPVDLQQFSDSASTASLFKSNKYFGSVTTDYFAQNSKILPLLHTWSLSIEWQCYLILPLAIYLIYRIFPTQYFSKIIYGLTLLSLILYFSYFYPNLTYYRFPSRIFEFLIGSCVAVSSIRFSMSKFFLEFISTAAIGTLFYIATLKNISLDFPNAYAVILCIATGVLILAGDNSYKALWVRFLSLKPIVFIGLLSYSIYIWHWPLFALLNYLDLKTPLIWLLAFSLVFIMAYLSWQFIEKPARQFSKTPIIYTLICLLIIPIVAMNLSSKIINKYEGFPDRFPEAEYVFQQLNQYASTRREACLVFTSSKVDENCKFGSNYNNSKKGFMIGDSFSNHYWKFMEVIAKEANISILANSTGSCLALPGIVQYYVPWANKQGVYSECMKQKRRYYRMIANNHYDYVIIGESWSGYFSSRIVNHIDEEHSPKLVKQRIERGLESALRAIIASGAKPVLIKSIVTSSKGNPYTCFFKHIKQHTLYNPEQCDFTLLSSHRQWVNATFAKLQQKYPQLIIIDPEQVLCTKNKCKADINNIPVFRDESHLTDYASYQLGERYLKHYKNPFDN
jgi:peptidoglycan/LPS O-acetylase OafA/YrhL